MLRIDLSLGPEGFGKLNLGPQFGEFKVKEVTFQFKSDHSVDGQLYDGEMQILHENADGELAVVCVFLTLGDEGEAAEFFNQFRYAVFDYTAAGFEMLLHKQLNLGDLSKQFKGKYWTYHGNLPYPPCKENVMYIVLARPVKLSEENLANLKVAYDANRFETQELGDRAIGAPFDWSKPKEDVAEEGSDDSGDADGDEDAPDTPDMSSADLHGGSNPRITKKDARDGRAAKGAITDAASLTPA
jgi:hypothetical protein